MDYSPHDETHFVRCLKCLKILKCSRYDTTTLLEHIRTDHPEIEIVESAPRQPLSGGGGGGGGGGGQSVGVGVDSDDLPTNNEERMFTNAGTPVQPSSETPNVTYSGGMDAKGNDADDETIYSRCQRNNSLSTHIPRQRWLYRTSIEKWRPATGTLYCPKCGSNKRPLIKTRTERLSGNTCGAACLLGCWPFCFLPFLCSGEDKEYLHCSNCKSFLGLYDRNHNCVRPNREFLESKENVPQSKAKGGAGGDDQVKPPKTSASAH